MLWHLVCTFSCLESLEVRQPLVQLHIQDDLTVHLLHVSDQGDKGSPGRVSRADVAAVCIAALEHPEKSAGRTIELAAQFADPPTPLTTVFDGTVPDSTA